jgi:flagellar biosynthesis/type III secretory pathway ATPase
MRILKKERAKLLRELCKYRDIMRGCLILLKRRCGTEKKYPAYFLSKSVRGKTVMRYIKKAEVEAVRDSLSRYKDLKELIERLCEINEELFILAREV